VQGLHGHLLGRPARSAADRRRAAARFAELVAKGTGEAPWAEHLRQQIYLGDA
jgi:putative transposase